MKLSLVIPLYNEEESVDALIAAVREALKDISYEIVLVDDGSSDGTVARVLAHEDSTIRLLTFSRNFGQTSAMAAGIDAAKGELIATMDGDLQNDPSDIPMMISMLEEQGLDVLAGRRAKRKDGFVLRKIPSKIANYLIRKATHTTVQDLGCSLKLFTATIAKSLDLHGELHRFIPILADMQGAKIGEVDVKHHARQYGTSKYGLGRTFKVASDLMLMVFFIRYRQKPMHLFGSLGLAFFLVGMAIETYLLLLKIMGDDIGGRPLFYIGILLLITSVQLITTGFIAELLMRTYHGANKTKPYVISQEYTGGKHSNKRTTTSAEHA